MTRGSKKEMERFFVQETSRRLGIDWSLSDDRENPDFIVFDGENRFGLEVSQIFNGLNDEKAGSLQRFREGETSTALEAIRRRYERDHQGPPLHLKFIGRPTSQTAGQILSGLASRKLQNHPIGHREDFSVGAGDKVYVQVVRKSRWMSLADRTGWVNTNPSEIIQGAISKKAERLPSYREAAGTDIRLLLVAYRILNSGKMELSAPFRFDAKGFSAVYFLSYPDSLTTLEVGPETKP